MSSFFLIRGLLVERYFTTSPSEVIISLGRRYPPPPNTHPFSNLYVDFRKGSENDQSSVDSEQNLKQQIGMLYQLHQDADFKKRGGGELWSSDIQTFVSQLVCKLMCIDVPPWSRNH